jgi:hypothetical protein
MRNERVLTAAVPATELDPFTEAKAAVAAIAMQRRVRIVGSPEIRQRTAKGKKYLLFTWQVVPLTPAHRH